MVRLASGRRPAGAGMTGEHRAPEPVYAQPALTIPFSRDNLGQVRSLVAALADQIGLDDRRVEALLVVATELATNAVRHAGGSGVLRLWSADGAVHLRVTDKGPGLANPERAGACLVPTTSDEGRGLWLARQLSDDLRVVAGERGTSATARFNLP